MAATTYFANRARAAVVTWDGVSAHSTPGLADLFTVDRGFEASFEWENHELYGTDSVFRVDEAKSQVKNLATLRGCKVDWALTSNTAGIGYCILKALNPTSYDGTILDSNTLQLFDVYIWQTGSLTPATNKFAIRIYGAYMENVPIPFPENDFIIEDLKFHGRTGAIVNQAVPTS